MIEADRVAELVCDHREQVDARRGDGARLSDELAALLHVFLVLSGRRVDEPALTGGRCVDGHVIPVGEPELDPSEIPDADIGLLEKDELFGGQ